MTRLALVVGLFALTAGPTATGCSSTSANQSDTDAAANASDDGSFDTAACTGAGGQCVVGDVSCAMKGPQSCGAPGPGGTFCCLDANPQSVGPVDAAPVDAADACAPSGCAGGACAGDTPTRSVSHLVDGCLVWQCCVPDDAGADAATDGGSADGDACAPPVVCGAACVAGRHNVTTMVDGCLVTECCAPDDAGTD